MRLGKMRWWLPHSLRRLGAYFAEPRRSAVSGALVAFCLLVPAWWVAGQWDRERLLADRRALIAAELIPRGNALDAALNRRLALLEGLGAFVRAELDSTGRIQERRFNTFAAGLSASARGIRSFVVAPGGVTRYVYPRVGNENDCRPRSAP